MRSRDVPRSPPAHAFAMRAFYRCMGFSQETIDRAIAAAAQRSEMPPQTEDGRQGGAGASDGGTPTSAKRDGSAGA